MTATQKQYVREEFDPDMTKTKRQNDTQSKIEMGGTVKKAGLSHLATNTLLGLLLDAAEQLQSENGKKIAERWTLAGALVFEQDAELKRQAKQQREQSRRTSV